MAKKEKKTNNCGCNKNSCENKDEKEISKLEMLKKENSELLQKINMLNSEINKYQIQIDDINKEYIQKVNEKAKEAKEILDKKIAENNEKSKQEIELKINKYIEDKFSSMLETIDRLSQIINTSSSSSEINNYLQGFKMFLTMFQNSLNELDIHQITVNIGDKFNEEYMQAFELVDDKIVGSNCVSSIVSQAYKYKNKIIKKAVVRVQK